MNVETLPISALHIDPANARRHGPRNLDAITSSLARFGQQKPIVIDQNNVVRAGNGTLAAAKALGWTTVQCVRTELIGLEASAFAIADNRTAELAEWDPDVLAAAMADPAIGDLAFDASEIESMLAKPSAELAEMEQALATPVGETFQIIIDCKTEEHQKELFEKLTAEGWPCRLLTL